MAFIGPRPELPEFVNYLSFRYLDKIKPGLSGYSSILFRDESYMSDLFNNDNSYEEVLKIKTCLDNYYTNKKSLLIDIKLVFFTILSIFFPKTMFKYFYNYILKLFADKNYEINWETSKNIKFKHDKENPIFGSQ